MSDQFFNGNFAIAEAQKCRQMLLDQTGQKSTWCIVTKKGFWPASYFFPGDENLVREKLNQGHEVVLVFAMSLRHVLASCSEYQAVEPKVATDDLLRRHARQAMRETALGRTRGLNFLSARHAPPRQ